LIHFMKIANSINFLTLVLFCFCLCAHVCSQIFTQFLCCFSTSAFQNTHEIFCVLVVLGVCASS
jgi:hypothetical protein